VVVDATCAIDDHTDERSDNTDERRLTGMTVASTPTILHEVKLVSANPLQAPYVERKIPIVNNGGISRWYK
jgi:hypothetical protein